MSDSGNDRAVLSYPGGEYELPIVRSSEGNDGLQLGKLLSETGYTTLDGGFVNTASTESAVTYIDGANGILRYRGYPIEQIAEKSTYMETAYLLIHGELPTAEQLRTFRYGVKYETELDEDFKRLYDAIPRGAHPMPALASGVAALSCYHPDCLDPFDEEQVNLATYRLLAKVPMIAAYTYRRQRGLPLLYPRHEFNLVENFLRLMFGSPAQEFDLDPEMVSVLDTLFILHEDHEQNCSTSTVRMVGSAHTNLFMSVAAGIGALYGPLHGGANQAVLEMLENIKADGGDATEFMERVKNKERGAKLMGFGHRVYKSYDPRAAIVKKHAHRVLEKLGSDELLDIALKLEETALKDDYFVERKLYPNVDFYTGLIYRAMGFPTEMFTVLFAIGRLPGWIAQWREMISDPATKISRPRQIYTGATERDYIGIEER